MKNVQEKNPGKTSGKKSGENVREQNLGKCSSWGKNLEIHGKSLGYMYGKKSGKRIQENNSGKKSRKQSRKNQRKNWVRAGSLLVARLFMLAEIQQTPHIGVFSNL